MLDGNVEAQGHSFFSLGGLSISEDGRWLAFSTDVVGNERYTVRFRNLDTGEERPETISDTTGGVIWSRDARYVYYQTVDDAWRPDTVWRRNLAEPGDPVQVFHEPDEGFWVGMGGSRSREYLFIGAGSKTTSQVRHPHVGPDGRTGQPAPRVPGVEYEVDHAIIGGRGYFLFTHNGPGPDGQMQENYTVDIAPVSDPSDRSTFIAHDPARRIEDIEAFEDYLVLSYRSERCRGWQSPICAASTASRPPTISSRSASTSRCARRAPRATRSGRRRACAWDTPASSSPPNCWNSTSPPETAPCSSGRSSWGLNPDDYEQSREWVTVDDGTRVPVSIVRRKREGDGPSPTLLYGYGSYEHSIDPSFSVPRLSLLDRGVVFAVAHVRGGGEMGRHWYENGKTLTKQHFHRLRRRRTPPSTPASQRRGSWSPKAGRPAVY